MGAEHLHEDGGIIFSFRDFYENFAASSLGPGSTRIEPSGKTMVGTLCMPPFIRTTYSAALSSSSILINSYGMPCASNQRLAIRQSPHHFVAYILITSCFSEGGNRVSCTNSSFDF